MKKLNKLEKLMRKAYEMYGQPRSIDFFGDQWRVWWTSFHEHPKGNPRVMTGDLCTHGTTLQGALEFLLAEYPKKYMIVQGSCRKGCPGYVDDCY